jgi:hypothetical protein
MGGGQVSLILRPLLYFGLIVLGFVLRWRRDRILTPLLVAPIGLTFAAAFARQYPFSDRLILFLTPSFFVAIGDPVQLSQATSASSPVKVVIVAVSFGRQSPRHDIHRSVHRHLQANSSSLRFSGRCVATSGSGWTGSLKRP